MRHSELKQIWQEKLAEYDPIKESFANFCRTRELKYAQALRWRKKIFSPSDTEARIEFTEMPFPTEGTGDYILRRAGWEILVPHVFDECILRKLLTILKEV